MRIKLSSVMVDDQAKALAFYTGILGFRKKQDVPMGGARWLTVVAPDDIDGVELLLEPIGFDFARTYQKALYDAGVPITAFQVDHIESEYQRLSREGVVFRAAPEKLEGGPTTAVFEDTCGNLIQIFQV
ncbi:VOC family protein [Desertibaculum subflavum]|uniref:VOC family protein n=1 Tax=Desertibaculum subflavum TaxID=2268458 RepID=UPI000E6688E1